MSQTLQEPAQSPPAGQPARSARPDPAHFDHCIALRDVGWKGYDQLLAMRGDRSRPKMEYLDGTVYLMSPAYENEWIRKRLGILVEAIVFEIVLPCLPAGQTTFRSQFGAGAEADEAYYLANESRVRGKRSFDLGVDPPPDLAIEAVHTHSAEAALEAWRRLGVPEVWVGDEDGLRIFRLQSGTGYVRSETSQALPFVSASELTGWLLRPQEQGETAWYRDLKLWVNETLRPRARVEPKA